MPVASTKTAKPPKKSVNAQKMRQLEAENKRLSSENLQLKATKRSGKSRFWRSLAIILCVGLAGALLVVGNLSFWMGRSIVDQDRYAAIIEPMIKEPAVQQGVATYATQRIYQNVDIEQKLADNLPEQAKPIAPVLAPQVQNITKQILLRIVQNPKFQDTWNTAQLNAHDRAITFIKNYKGDGTIDIADVYKQLSQRLNDTKLSFLANKNLPDKVGSITIANAPWLPVAHNLVVNLELYRALTVLAVILLTVLAVWLSRRRRRLIITVGLLYAVLMFLSLVSYKLAQQQLVSHTAAAYQPAVEVIASHLFRPLVIQTRMILLLGLLVSSIAWISGPTKAAQRLRGLIQTALNGHLHQAIFRQENSFTNWVGRHKVLLQWLGVALIAVIMLSVQLSPRLVVSYAIVMVLLVLLVELVAAALTGQKTGRRLRNR